ncbi:MAG TPA: hypothetical protein VE978_15085 [Chitinophagales bacterium]|nr:hypothetical protein [Chitinophagales bacterium]
MEPITIVTWLVSAAKFLKDTGADGAVKEGAKSFFSWVKGKFTRKSEQEKIETVIAAPDNEDAIKGLEQMISDTQKDDAALIASLQDQVNQFSKLVEQKMPQAAASINNQITNSKNVVVDGFKNISSQGNISINVGDNNPK